MSYEERVFDSADEAAGALASAVTRALLDGIGHRGEAGVALSPRPALLACFARLREQALDWSRVTFVLTDDAWVPPASGHSGEQLLRRHLLLDDLLDARLVGLRTGHRKPVEAVVELGERHARLARPLDAVVLAMDADGGIAGLVPGTPALEAMLKPDWAVKVAPVTAAVVPAERITLTLSALLDARAVFLLVPQAASAAYAQARAGSGPAAALLRQRRTPVCVLSVVP